MNYIGLWVVIGFFLATFLIMGAFRLMALQPVDDIYQRLVLHHRFVKFDICSNYLSGACIGLVGGLYFSATITLEQFAMLAVFCLFSTRLMRIWIRKTDCQLFEFDVLQEEVDEE